MNSGVRPRLVSRSECADSVPLRPGTRAAQNLPWLKTRSSGLTNKPSAAATDLCGRGSQASTEEVDRRGVVMASAWPKPDFVAKSDASRHGPRESEGRTRVGDGGGGNRTRVRGRTARAS